MKFRKHNRMHRRVQRGFTLVELLLVLVILALIGGFVLPNLIGTGEKAKARAAGSAIGRISLSVDNYYLDTGQIPSSLEELIDEPAGSTGWNGPYIKSSMLNDPWNRPYVYRSPGEHGDYDIASLGADGQAGGEDNNADINNWD